MHGLLITFVCEASPDDLAEPFADYAARLRDQPGLVSKAWIATDDGYGGFHVFLDRAAAEGYLSSELAAGLMATEGFDDFEVRHFDVLDDLSALTGVVAAAA